MKKVMVYLSSWKWGIKVEHGAIHKFEEIEQEEVRGIAEQIYMTEAIWAQKRYETAKRRFCREAGKA